MTSKTMKQLSPELRERAIRMVLDREREGGSQWESIGSIASKIGCSRETVHGAASGKASAMPGSGRG